MVNTIWSLHITFFLVYDDVGLPGTQPSPVSILPQTTIQPTITADDQCEGMLHFAK